MLRAVRHLFVAGSIALAAPGCAEDNTELANRVKAIQARQAAERDLDRTDFKGARLELTLAGGGNTWCPSSLQPPQLRAVLYTGGDVALSTPVRTTAHPTTAGLLPRSAVDVKISTGELEREWTLVAPTQHKELVALLTQPMTMKGHLVRKPSIAATLQLSTTFDCDQGVEFPGRPGRAGGVGGMRGEDGENGLDVLVGVSYLKVATGRKLVFVRAAPAIGSPVYFLLAPGRRLGINVRGGFGGAGGDGEVTSHNTTVNFSGGLGGDGGNGGRVVVQVDSRYPELRSVVTAVSPGGKGGDGGKSGYGGRAADARSSAGRAGRPGPPARHQNGDADEIFVDEIEAGLPILRSDQPDTQI